MAALPPNAQKDRFTSVLSVLPQRRLRRRLFPSPPRKPTQTSESGGEEWKCGGQWRRHLRRHCAESVVELELAAAACCQREDDLNVRETAAEQSADINRAPG